ncbi:hypothetical protein LCGC14_0815740 [marine sediment metagenome]|uniref:Uncharacterized protein n=1 Tax=marine sediment metagenome TaxID=412755 RepID=A0A0F9PPZ1_9ZZZZ
MSDFWIKFYPNLKNCRISSTEIYFNMIIINQLLNQSIPMIAGKPLMIMQKTGILVAIKDGLML